MMKTMMMIQAHNVYGGRTKLKAGVAFSKASHVGSIQRSSVMDTHGGMPLDTIVRLTV